MEAETAAAPASQRPRPILLVLLAVVAGGAALMWLRPAAGPTPPASYPTRSPAQQTAGGETAIDPSRLDVQLEALEAGREAPADSERNPFRFRPKAPPPPERPQGPGRPQQPDEAGAAAPPLASPPPPITVKFLGTIQLADGTVRAVFTDCSAGGRRTEHVKEGDVVLGQYRLVKVGVESAIVEHLDGRGRTTIPQTGQECVWK
jgi:hypothetical protein